MKLNRKQIKAAKTIKKIRNGMLRRDIYIEILFNDMSDKILQTKFLDGIRLSHKVGRRKVSDDNQKEYAGVRLFLSMIHDELKRRNAIPEGYC